MSQELTDLSKNIGVTVGLPANLHVELVQSTHLSEYEVWALISSLLSNVSIAFLIYYLQNIEKAKENIILTITVIFWILFGISVFLAFNKRKKLSENRTIIKL